MKISESNRRHLCLMLLLVLGHWNTFPVNAQMQPMSPDHGGKQNSTLALFYQQDFEHGVGAEWSKRMTTTAPSGRKFLGRFGSETDNVSLKLKALPSHTAIKITFDLYVIGSWDGNGNRCCGPDVWSLRIKNGPTLVNHTFSNTGFDGNLQSWPAGGDNPAQTGAYENNFLGYGEYGGEANYQMSFTLSHDDDSLQLYFSGLLPDPTPGKENESWGLDNVQISLSSTTCSSPSFDTPRGFGAGQTPRGIVAADFNGDGLDDLAITNNESFNLTILRATDGGNFVPAPGSPIFIGARPYSVVTADFNHDGKADLAVGESRPEGNIHILLGNGDGRFLQAIGSPFTLPIFRNAISLVTADFNQDGNTDLAVGHSDASEATIFLGDGHGKFTMASRPALPLDVSFYNLAAGDFNGDKYPDLVAAGNDSGRVSILLGNGDGTFRQALGSPFLIGERPRGIAVADYNGDGREDLALTTVNINNNASNDFIVIRFGKGDGRFNLAENISTAKGPGSILTDDFNQDGWPDLAVVRPGVQVRLGTGSGSSDPTALFGAPTSYEAGGLPWAGTTGDFNGDGHPDLATANATSNDVTVLLNTCVSYDVCIQDEENRGALQFNSQTGEYRFVSCESNGFTLTGKGNIINTSCLSILTDHQIIATYNQCTHKGVAIILKSPHGPLIFINDKNTQNSGCSCTVPH